MAFVTTLIMCLLARGYNREDRLRRRSEARPNVPIMKDRDGDRDSVEMVIYCTSYVTAFCIVPTIKFQSARSRDEILKMKYSLLSGSWAILHSTAILSLRVLHFPFFQRIVWTSWKGDATKKRERGRKRRLLSVREGPLFVSFSGTFTRATTVEHRVGVGRKPDMTPLPPLKEKARGKGDGKWD